MSNEIIRLLMLLLTLDILYKITNIELKNTPHVVKMQQQSILLLAVAIALIFGFMAMWQRQENQIRDLERRIAEEEAEQPSTTVVYSRPWWGWLGGRRRRRWRPRH